MDNKILEEVQARVEADEDNQELFKAYDDMDCMVWEPPSNLLKDWVRIRINSSAHDALKQMSNIFDTHNPKWEILPLGEADADRAEELETWLEFHASKANLNGEKSPFRQGLYNSGKFNRVIYEVDYLPYWLPSNKSDWTPEQKANAANGPFCFTAHDPRCIYYDIGKYGLRWIANVNNLDAQTIINHWSIYESDTKEGKQIKSGIAKLKAMQDDDDINLIYMDYTSMEKRVVVCFKTAKDDISDFKEMEFDKSEAIVILDGENKLKFIPYAVATGDSDALLHSLYAGGIWENQNMIDTIVDSSVLRRAFFPLLKHTSVAGKDIDINYDGSQDVVELGQGEDAQVLNAPAIDTGLTQLAASNSMKMGQAVGIRNLGLQDIAGNVQFSTVQAQIQLQLTALQPYKRTDEKALSQLALLMFKWIKFTGKGAIGYRTSKRVKKDKMVVGEQILITPEDFDPDEMLIQCTLLSNTPTDRQQLVNMLVALKQAGAAIPWTDIVELLQMFGNPELLKGRFQDEQIEQAAMKNFVDEQALKLQLQGQAQTMQMQMQMQQAQMQQQQQAQQQQQMSPEQQQAMAQQGGANPPEQDAVQAGGQENNAAAGGEPAMMANPGLTRNNVRQPG